jgi:hypothetical protein
LKKIRAIRDASGESASISPGGGHVARDEKTKGATKMSEPKPKLPPVDPQPKDPYQDPFGPEPDEPDPDVIDPMEDPLPA